MRSALIILNNYVIDPELLLILKKMWRVYVADNTWDGQTIMEKNHMDIFIIFSDDHINQVTWRLIKEIHKKRSRMTPIIFVAEKQSEDLISPLADYGGWYFEPYPLDHQKMLKKLDYAMEDADVLHTKAIRLKKRNEVYDFKIKHVIYVERIEAKRIRVCFYNPATLVEETEEFYDALGLSSFTKRHGIESYMKQTHQSWLVNTSFIRKLQTRGKSIYEIILLNGTNIPTGRKHIENFLKEWTSHD